MYSAEAKGYQGIGYLATWDLKDYDYVRNWFRTIRAMKNGALASDFSIKLERVWNDQTTDIEPIEVVQGRNRIVNDGLVRVAELITGSSSSLWTHLAVGNGISPVSMSDSFLQSEIERVALGTDGFQTPAGSVLRYGGFFSPSVNTSLISEAGVFDDPTEGIMFFRTVYTTPINHVVNVDFFSVAHSIYQVSV